MKLDLKLQGIDENGVENTYSVDDFEGKTVVLYFYPKDATPGCTKEACAFRDNYNRLTSDAIVVGVSPDGIKSHKAFQKKENLNFILLSDPEHLLADEFGVWGEKSMYGKKYMGIIRSTFIFNKNSRIINHWKNVKVSGHVDEVLEFLENHDK